MKFSDSQCCVECIVDDVYLLYEQVPQLDVMCEGMSPSAGFFLKSSWQVSLLYVIVGRHPASILAGRQGQRILNRLANRISARKLGYQSVMRRFMTGLCFLPGCCLIRLRVNRRSEARFWAACRFRVRLSSSRNVKSRLQWLVFSMLQWPRTDRRRRSHYASGWRCNTARRRFRCRRCSMRP